MFSQNRNERKSDPICTFIYLFILIFLFIYGCVGSSFLCEGFLQLWQAGATLHRGARASHYRVLSSCGAQAPDAQVACGIFPDQGSNPCPLHWQADSQPLRHQGSPQYVLLNEKKAMCPRAALVLDLKCQDCNPNPAIYWTGTPMHVVLL